MIVKNESKIIEETLNSIYKYVDTYVINDTGSTDDTREKIRNFFDSKNIKGEIIDHEFRSCNCHMDNKYKKYNWFHFGWNRTYALEKCIGKSDYILIMDADDIIIGELPLPEKVCDENYQLLIGNNFQYYRPQLIRNDAKIGWKYNGGLHEYLDSSIPVKYVKLEGNYYIDSRRLGARNQDPNKYLNDAKIFEQLLKKEPSNERYMFYCAQSYYDHKDFKNSMKYYEKRVSKRGFKEEVFYSLYKIALCKKNLEYTFDQIIHAFLKCYNYYPQRAEALYEIIHFYRLNDKFNEGYAYARKALAIPFPVNDNLFVFKDIYDYKLKDEIALCAYYICKYQEAYNLWMSIMEEKKFPDSEFERLSTNLHFARDQIMQKKPKLCFYVGYISDYNKNINDVYGSELALQKISKLFTEDYDVYIFGPAFERRMIDKITFMNSTDLNDFGKKNEIDIMIISRYIHYFLEFKINVRKTYLWLHDMLLQPFWNGKPLPSEGKYLLENMMDRIDGVIVLCEWHKQNVLNFFEIDSSKIFIIGNGIDINDFDHQVEKVKNRFIYISNPIRGLSQLIEHFHTIREKIVDAELYIYRGLEEFNNQKIVEELKKFDYIKFQDKLPNKKLIPEIMKAEYWYYPTNFYETYCISALEAQMAGCLCITTKLAALTHTVGDRGILIDKIIYSEEYWNEAINAIINFNNNPELKITYIKKEKEWAQKQTWKERSKEWLELLKQ